MSDIYWVVRGYFNNDNLANWYVDYMYLDEYETLTASSRHAVKIISKDSAERMCKNCAEKWNFAPTVFWVVVSSDQLMIEEIMGS